MFDLKEKLLKAGLVTEGQVEKVKEEEKRQKPNALKKGHSAPAGNRPRAENLGASRLAKSAKSHVANFPLKRAKGGNGKSGCLSLRNRPKKKFMK